MIAIIILSVVCVYLFIRIGKLKFEYDRFASKIRDINKEVEHYKEKLQDALEEISNLRDRPIAMNDISLPRNRESIKKAKLLGTKTSNPKGRYRNDWRGNKEHITIKGGSNGKVSKKNTSSS